MPEANRPAGRRVGPFTIQRASHAPLFTRHVKLVAGVGLFLAVFHDSIYRRDGGTDFEVYGLVSHAGLDMLVVTFAVTLAVFLVRER